MRRLLLVSLIAAGSFGVAQANAAPPNIATLPAYVQAQEKLRKICVDPAFLACMRWEQRLCVQKVDDAIAVGNQRAAPQVETLAPRHRQHPEIVSGMYWGATIGALLKASGMRLNNCLPNPKSL